MDTPERSQHHDFCWYTIGWQWRNFVPYLCQLVSAAILWVKLSEMFATLMSFKYALSAGWWSCGHFPQLVKFYSNNTVKSSPINSTRYAKLYPQNGDRIVAIDSVTTFYPMYFKQTCSFHLPVSATRWVLFASTPLTPLLYNHGHHSHQHRYDTIRDAILACARKPTWVGLIYRTESTTKNCKTEKLKSKSRYVRSNSKSLGNHYREKFHLVELNILIQNSSKQPKSSLLLTFRPLSEAFIRRSWY